ALSAKVAVCATALCLPTGIFFGWLMARREFAGKWILDTLVQLPMVLPPVVPGYFLLLLLGTRGPIGKWLLDTFGIVVAFTWKGAVLASATMAFPLMVQPARLAFRLIDVRLEQAAKTLGATPWRAFATITLPLAFPGIVAGSVLVFLCRLGEVGAPVAVVGEISGGASRVTLAGSRVSHRRRRR